MASKSTEELRKIFTQFASKEGDPSQLSQSELKELIQNEFPDIPKVSPIDVIFKEMDKNNDGEISFEEFEAVIKKIKGGGQ